MALLGRDSTAHHYDRSGQCVYCGTYRAIITQIHHVCTREREIETDGWWLGKKMRKDAVYDPAVEAIEERHAKIGIAVPARRMED